MKKLTLASGLLSLAILTGCVKEIQQTPTLQTDSAVARGRDAEEQTGDDYVPNELLIRFKQNVTEKGRANALARISGRVKEFVGTSSQYQNDGFYVVNVPNGVVEAIERLQGLMEVDYAEPNYIYSIPENNTAAYEVDDPYYAAPDNLWGMMGELTTAPYRNQYASRAAEVWQDIQPDGSWGTIPEKKHTGSQNVYVAVIDQGVDDDHEDFKWSDETGAKNNIATQYGKDFVSGDNDPDPTHPAEDHGTHVAGTIGAVGNNTFGVAGVNWKVSIISVRFLDHNGYGTAANAAKAIDYVTELKRQGVNVVATNNSWGGLSSKTLQAAIERANQAGILFIVSAGNSNSDNDRRAVYPSSYASINIISVASITPSGAKSNFSNWGLRSVDIAAPGSYIWSTVPVGCYIDNDKDGLNNGVGWMSGTSMAAPHVTGAVALYAAAKGLTNITQAQAQGIKTAIFNSARPTIAFRGKCVTGGRLDIRSALQNTNNSTLDAD